MYSLEQMIEMSAARLLEPVSGTLRWLISSDQWSRFVRLRSDTFGWLVQSSLQANGQPTICGIPVSVVDAPGMDAVLIDDKPMSVHVCFTESEIVHQSRKLKPDPNQKSPFVRLR